jgi:hypothetical protein
MRTKFIITTLVLLGIFTSCKNEKSVDSLEVVQPEVTVDNSFKVTLGVVVKKDDDFSLFYTEDGSANFKGEPIWQGVKGNEMVQQVVYTLPDGVFPTQLRMDFGMNKEQEDIILKSVVLEYKGNKREFIGVNLIDFFRADENKCTFDPSTGLIKAKVVDGVRQFPSLYPHEANLKPEIEKLAK